jgi:uncharacterized protein YlxP (DUF503 family)
MVIGTAVFTLAIDQAYSLKDKRSVLEGLKTRLKNKFNIAVSEVGMHDIWNRCELAVVTVSPDRKRVDQLLSKVALFIEGYGDAVLLDIEQEIF